MQFGRILCAAALLLLACASAEAGDSAYRLLTLNGGNVRWFPKVDQSAPVVRFAIATSDIHSAGAVNCGDMGPPATLLRTSAISPDAFRAAAADAFARWQAVVDISFVEAASVAEADIIIGEQLVPVGFAFTNIDLDANSPARSTPDGRAVRSIERALICLNPQRPWKIGFDGNIAIYDLTHTLAHEIGHALGLDHPNDRSALMSFRYHEQVPSLTEGDIRGAVAIYGARHAPTGTIATAAAGERTIVRLD